MWGWGGGGEGVGVVAVEFGGYADEVELHTVEFPGY